jgi:hypothetical protein
MRRLTKTLELYRKRTGATAPVRLDLRSSLSIQPFERSRFVRGVLSRKCRIHRHLLERAAIESLPLRQTFDPPMGFASGQFLPTQAYASIHFRFWHSFWRDRAKNLRQPFLGPPESYG